MNYARVELARISDIVNGKKDGLTSITTSDKDPKFAAGLANAYVDKLIKITQTMAISEASQWCLFFEQQLKGTKYLLADVEIALRTIQKKRDGPARRPGRAIISAITQIKGTIAAKEVQLNAMRTFATERNFELLHTQEELHCLQVQLVKLEKNRLSNEGDFMVPTGETPAEI